MTEERWALKELKACDDIVIKGADKGSAVVVGGRQDYCKEVYRQLEEEQVYEIFEENPLGDLTKLVENKLKGLKSSSSS